jgi:hypothetical protein
MPILNFPDPKNRVTEQPDGSIAFDGSPDELIALIIDDALALVQKERLERVGRNKDETRMTNDE